MVALLLPSLHQIINILFSINQSRVDDLPVDKGGAPGNRGEEPDNKEDLAFIVERKPEPKKEVSEVLGQSKHSEYYPVCHPMNIVLYKYFYKTSPSLINLFRPIYENPNTGKVKVPPIDSRF